MEVTVPSLAKINLDLRVLYKRNDGYHELRSLFQTISLRDTIEIQFESARKSDFTLESSLDIPDNLVLRAARLISDELNIKARIRLKLRKRIPMGAGLGGGSSNAAAVLIALAALARKPVSFGRLIALGEKLGSDVPFFLLGGTAVGIGRGNRTVSAAGPAAQARAGGGEWGPRINCESLCPVRPSAYNSCRYGYVDFAR